MAPAAGWSRDARGIRMSFRLSFHQAPLGPSGAHWLDDPSDLTCKDSTQHHPVDDPLLSCKQQVAGSSLARGPNPQIKPDRWLL
jgi:hypothetical protein